MMEGILDHIFVSLGIDDVDGGIGRPVLMTEPIANLGYSRKSGLALWLFPGLLLTQHSYE